MKIKIMALILCAAALMTVLTACRDKENVPVEEDAAGETASETTQEGETAEGETTEPREVKVTFGGNLEKQSTTVDAAKAENAIKSALLNEIISKELLGFSADTSKVTPAEGHATLRTEKIDGQVYAYVTAAVDVYSKDGELFSGMSAPFVLIFDVDDSGDYVYADYKMPAEGENFKKSLEEIFPEDLVAEALDVDYGADFYQDQIKAYLDQQ